MSSSTTGKLCVRSDCSKKDLKEKTIIYARNNIAEYWVVDLPHQKLWVFTKPKLEGYSQTQEFTTGTINPISFPAIPIEVKNLLLYQD